MITRDANGNVTLNIGVDTWDGESEVSNGDFIGMYKHVELHAVNRDYYRMKDKENRAYGLKPNGFDYMKLPSFKGVWVDLIDRYPIGKVVTINKVRFEICKVEVSLPVDAFGDPTSCQDYFIDVHFKLEGSEVIPSEIVLTIG